MSHRESVDESQMILTLGILTRILKLFHSWHSTTIIFLRAGSKL